MVSMGASFYYQESLQHVALVNLLGDTPVRFIPIKMSESVNGRRYCEAAGQVRVVRTLVTYS